MTYQVINPFIQFVDPKNGNPLSAGSVYFGRQDSDPKNQPANRINVYAVQDNGSEVLLSQPITLNGAGQPQYSGSVKQIKIELYAGELSYALQLFNKNGSQKGYSPRVYSLLDMITGVSKDALANVNSTVIIGGAEAADVGKVANLFVTPEMFGAVGDGIANDSAAIKNWLESPYKKVGKRGATYNLGLLAGDASLASTNGLDHDIDFNYCKMVCAGDISAVYTATAMFRVTNGRLSVRNLAGFNDTNFASRGAGRGVAPWLIVNDGVNTEGYSLENIVLDNCQSFGTFFSADSAYQAKGIQIGSGCVMKGNCERGITLSDSGSSISGSFRLSGTVNRNLFAQNVSGIDLLIYGGTCAASNGNVLVTCSDGKTMSNIKLRIRNEQIYSVSVIAKGAGSTFKNIDIDVWSDAIGDTATEVIRFGAQDNAGNWLPSVNFTARDIKFKVRSNTKQFVEFAMQTYSINVEYVSLDVFGNYTFYNQGPRTYFEMKNKFYKSETLSSIAVPLSIDTSRFIKNVANIGLEIYVKGSGSGGVEIAAKYYVKAFKDSGGALNTFSSSTIYSFPVSGGGATLSASGQNINVTYSGFAGVLFGTVAVSLFEF